MLKRTVQNIGEKGYKNTRTWVDLEDISPIMVRAVMASEDGRFMELFYIRRAQLVAKGLRDILYRPYRTVLE